jgi:hypothetical protein
MSDLLRVRLVFILIPTPEALLEDDDSRDSQPYCVVFEVWRVSFPPNEKILSRNEDNNCRSAAYRPKQRKTTGANYAGSIAVTQFRG